jgi:murein DD-endopeptidase MepM/ murein hydrolase activator NlpD
MSTSAAPQGRRWRKAITLGTAAATLALSVCAGAAFGQTGGIDAGGGGTEPPPTGDDTTAPSHFKLDEAKAAPHKTYFDGRRAPKVSYTFEGDAPTDVVVEVIDRATKTVIDSWTAAAAQPGVANAAYWDGRTATGAVAKGGEYKFRIGAAGAKAEATADSRFQFHGYKFPIRYRRHTYGDGYGAGRNHMGQDVFAPCGSKLVAARGGKVQWNRSQSAAGNYLVIDGKGTEKDFFYAHLKKRSPLQEGDRVKTGQPIGLVGQSGNASGCHLHMEIWSAPGWYEGGEALPSVTRSLKKWDKWS